MGNWIVISHFLVSEIVTAFFFLLSHRKIILFFKKFLDEEIYCVDCILLLVFNKENFLVWFDQFANLFISHMTILFAVGVYDPTIFVLFFLWRRRLILRVAQGIFHDRKAASAIRILKKIRSSLAQFKNEVGDGWIFLCIFYSLQNFLDFHWL